jgi:hypothetical protein
VLQSTYPAGWSPSCRRTRLRKRFHDGRFRRAEKPRGGLHKRPATRLSRLWLTGGAALRRATTAARSGMAGRPSGSSTRVYVGSLAWATTREDLAHLFSQAGSVISVEVSAYRAPGGRPGGGVGRATGPPGRGGGRRVSGPSPASPRRPRPWPTPPFRHAVPQQPAGGTGRQRAAGRPRGSCFCVWQNVSPPAARFRSRRAHSPP